MRGFDAASRRVAARGVPALALLLLACAGCGHRATAEECEEIVERIARLDLEKRMPDNPQAVEEQIASMKAQLRENAKRECVGKRITESAMRCVRQAKSSQEIVERCFD
jgi:small lipoprotein (TIGR04454 family)